jgi:hypothetical protein
MLNNLGAERRRRRSRPDQGGLAAATRTSIGRAWGESAQDALYIITSQSLGCKFSLTSISTVCERTSWNNIRD